MAKKKSPSEILDDIVEIEIDEINDLKENGKKLTKEHLISTGSTLLDIALSNTIHGGILLGKYYHFVGASTSGKTMTLLHILASMICNPKYDDIDIFVDEPEDGNEIDMEEMFGPVTASRIKAPNYNKDGTPKYSVKVEDFYDTVEKKLRICEETGRRFVYVEDSMDALTSDADAKKNDENMALRDAGKDAGGSFGMSKASVNSKRLGSIRNKCRKLGCTLFIISQERDDQKAQHAGAKTYSGGHALKFYADAQLWFKHTGIIEATVKGKDRCVGNKAIVNVTKNRLTGQKHKKIPIEISFNYGIDNIGPLIDYLVGEKVWSGKTKIDTGSTLGIKEPLSPYKLIQHIEDNDKEPKLLELVQSTHDEIQNIIKNKFKRKKRYK